MDNNVQKEKFSGIRNNMAITFTRSWSGHRFTDEECLDLLAGKEIKFEALSKKGSIYTAKGKLEQQEFNGKTFWGFKPDFSKTIPDEFAGYTFNQEQKDELEKGQVIFVQGLISKKTGNKYDAYLKFDKDKGMQMSFNNEA